MQCSVLTFFVTVYKIFQTSFDYDVYFALPFHTTSRYLEKFSRLQHCQESAFMIKVFAFMIKVQFCRFVKYWHVLANIVGLLNIGMCMPAQFIVNA